MAIRQKRNRGFTLLEIMVVLLIMTVLFSIAIPSFMRSREVARARSCSQNLRVIDVAKEQWAMDNHRSPGAPAPAMSDLVGPGLYIKVEPTCPSDGTYDIGSIGTRPTCSIGGTAGSPTAHLLP